VRDTEPHSTPPASHTEWEEALFAAPVNVSSWRTNFRNPAYTERFQIVRKWDASKSDYDNGLKPVDGYMSVPLNGQVAKYSGGALTPTNTNYYVLYYCGSGTTTVADHTPLIRIREEFTDN